MWFLTLVERTIKCNVLIFFSLVSHVYSNVLHFMMFIVTILSFYSSFYSNLVSALKLEHTCCTLLLRRQLQVETTDLRLTCECVDELCEGISDLQVRKCLHIH